MEIKALEQQPCEDCISREAVDEYITNLLSGYLYDEERTRLEDLTAYIWGMPSVTPKAEQKWIPVKSHKITDEEREKEGYPEEWHFILDCEMPEEGQEILVTIKRHKENYVEKDTAYNDCDGWYLDSGYDWREDAIAWMPLPEPYKAESEDKE